MDKQSQPPRLVLLVTKDSYVLSHRYDLALFLKSLGYEVCIACQFDNKLQKNFQQDGFKTYDVPFDRASINPFKEIKTLLSIFKLYHSYRPSAVLQVAFKPALYGGLCAKLLKIPKIVNTFGGVGYAFTQNSLKAKGVRLVVRGLLSLVQRRFDWSLIVQNKQDQHLWSRFVAVKNVHLVPGAGINLDHYDCLPFPTKKEPFTFTLVARMLWTKGINEFVQAATEVKKLHPHTRFLLVGGVDESNPAHIPLEVLQNWNKQGVVEWLGHKESLKDIYLKTHVAVLPSYREGLPKSLLEAMSYARPILTTTAPGCEECVTNNGMLVAPRSKEELQKAMEELINSPLNSLQEMGNNSRELIKTTFDQRLIFSKMRLFF